MKYFALAWLKLSRTNQILLHPLEQLETRKKEVLLIGNLIKRSLIFCHSNLEANSVRSCAQLQIVESQRPTHKLISFFHLRWNSEDPSSGIDGVLLAKVLPDVWHQQGEVGSSHRFQVQLPRETRRANSRDHASQLLRGGHRCAAGNHGGESMT